MSWFIPVLLAWPASDRIEVIPQPDPPVAASARVLAMAQQVEFRRVDARPDPEHAEDGGEQVVVAGRLACNVPHAIQRTDEHTSELQSLMSTQDAMCCRKK